jgi:hypothetical protein
MTAVYDSTLAMHAIMQAERERQEFGVPWHSLWTGDLGIALFAHACLNAESIVPLTAGILSLDE